MAIPKQIPTGRGAHIIAAASAAIMLLYLVLQAGNGNASFLSGFFRSMVVALGLVLIVLFLVTYYLHTIKKLPLHIIAAFVIPVLGLGYMTVIPLNTVPDEWTHIRATYELSNRFLGEEAYREDGLIPMRSDDTNVSFLPWTEGQDLPNRGYGKEQYAAYWERFGTPLSDGTIVPGVEHIHYPYPPHHNIMQAVGLSVGRLLGCGTYDAYLMGRLFALAFYTAMICWSVWLIPVRKTMLFLVAALPMALQQGMSYSYDCMVNALAFWLFAMAVRLIVRTDITGRRFLFSFGLLCAGSVLMVNSKQHAYFILALLPVLVFYHRELLPKKWILTSGVVCALLACIAVLAVTLRLAAHGFNALNALHVLVRSLIHYTGILVTDCIGARLGSLDVPAPTSCIGGFLALGLLSALKRSDGTLRLTREDRLVFAAIAAGGYLSFTVGHLIYWTPPDAMFVEGLQGRYLLPVLLPLLSLLDNDTVTCDDRVDALIVPAAVFLHFFVLTQILIAA